MKTTPEAIVTPSAFETGKLESLSVEDIKKITRSLSTHRRKLNQELENIRQQIDAQTQRLESEGEQTRAQILELLNLLNDRGQLMSQRLAQIDQHLRETRIREDQLLNRFSS